MTSNVDERFDEHFLFIENNKQFFVDGLPRILVCEGKRPRTKKNILTKTWGYSSKELLNRNFKAVFESRNENNLGFAVVTGLQPFTNKKLVVVDVDINDFETKNKLLKELPETFTVESSRGGLHFYYYTTEPLFKTIIRYKNLPVDVLNNSSIVVFPNKTNGYEVCSQKNINHITDSFELKVLSILPTILKPIERIVKTEQKIFVIDNVFNKTKKQFHGQTNSDLIPVGCRNTALVQHAGKINKYCLSRNHLTMSLKMFRDTCCEESGSVLNEEIKSIVNWITKKDTASFTLFNKPNVLTHSTTIDFRTIDKKFINSLTKTSEEEKYSSFEELKIKHKNFVESLLGTELKKLPPNHVLADLLKEHGFMQYRVGKQRLRKWNVHA